MGKRYKKSEFGCIFVIVLVIAVLITLAVLYSMNPSKIQETITNMESKIEESINKLSGKQTHNYK